MIRTLSLRVIASSLFLGACQSYQVHGDDERQPEKIEKLSPQDLEKLAKEVEKDTRGLRYLKLAALQEGNERKKRLLRWSLLFDTKTGADYAKQLAALEAILAVPDKEGKYLVIRDLTQRPVKLEDEDLKKINRIFWIDDEEKSVGPLSQQLGLKEKPAHVVAFFPEKLEKELAEKELKFANKKVDDIQQTRFRVIRSGDKYAVVVIEQK
jgi:hypothetical protein